MGKPIMRRIYLRLIIIGRRLNYWQCLGCVIASLAIIATIALPARTAVLEAANAELRVAQQLSAPSAVKKSAAIDAQDRLKTFKTILGKLSERENHIKTLRRIAVESNLAIQKAIYKSDFNRQGGYYTYQATLPVRGTYSSIRAFCDRLLKEMHFAAIDSVEFSRSAIDATGIDSKIVVTLYLDMPASTNNQSRHEAIATPIPLESVIK